MPKQPTLSGKIVIRKLERCGDHVVRQKGSHVRLRHSDQANFKPITVPLHSEIKPGLLHQIIKDANIGLDDFVKL